LNSRLAFLALIALAAVASPSLCSAQPKEAPKLYKWVDDKGVVHYGDTIPPEYANRDRSVLNDRGVRVGFEEGEITDQEREVAARKQAEAEAARAAKLEEARRDRSLLETYASVTDIEELRDRRVELLDSQIKVAELYLGNLRKRLVTLQEEASDYKPYTTRENAPQIPANLALDISRTAESINGYERTLAQTRADQEALKAAFDKDIRRFKELKGG
jgi:hypothetical protein